ncbi:hypothetical protein [Pseudovibrio sp. SPO723]|uniref:hypothetical protein n=1 Tax=Nesiotobacter zosterae TaxID=392721 RepID=UPI0029C39E10|nr:hypothetical protein [Pseudovibrio sp. SPO723]MDX5595488.1 hypothetical protein [Pseudovibrio sp. SPO723]
MISLCGGGGGGGGGWRLSAEACMMSIRGCGAQGASLVAVAQAGAAARGWRFDVPSRLPDRDEIFFCLAA